MSGCLDLSHQVIPLTLHFFQLQIRHVKRSRLAHQLVWHHLALDSGTPLQGCFNVLLVPRAIVFSIDALSVQKPTSSRHAVVVDFLPVLRPNEGLHNFRLSSQRREYLFPILVFHEGNVVIVRPLRKPELLLRKDAFYDSAHDVCLLVMHTVFGRCPLRIQTSSQFQLLLP